jgi:hypothetical protein
MRHSAYSLRIRWRWQTSDRVICAVGRPVGRAATNWSDQVPGVADVCSRYAPNPPSTTDLGATETSAVSARRCQSAALRMVAGATPAWTYVPIPAGSVSVQAPARTGVTSDIGRLDLAEPREPMLQQNGGGANVGFLIDPRCAGPNEEVLDPLHQQIKRLVVQRHPRIHRPVRHVVAVPLKCDSPAAIVDKWVPSLIATACLRNGKPSSKSCFQL